LADIVDLGKVLEFVFGRFSIASGNDVLVLTSSIGGPESIDVPDGDYSASELATALQTAMTANGTISGSTITWSVSYSDSTAKFTIDAGSGNTVALTNSGSDAADTFGFNKDHTAAQTITSDQIVPGAPDSLDIPNLHDGAEKWIQNRTERTFTSTTYYKLYDGDGDTCLLLDDYPITQVQRVTKDVEEGIKIKNTSTDASNAYAAVVFEDDTPSYLKLVVDDGDNVSTSSLSFSTYTTLSTLVAAFTSNATISGDGWAAAVYDTDYNNYSTMLLMENFYELANEFGGGTADYEYLYIGGEPLQGIKVYKDRGEIYHAGGFTRGHNNIYVKYTAGYSIAPADLRLAVCILVKTWYDKKDNAAYGIEEYSLGHVRVRYASGTQSASGNVDRTIPPEVLNIVDRYVNITL